MSFTFRLRRLVDAHYIVGTISRDGRHRIVDLFDQGGCLRTVTCPTTGQLRGDDLTRASHDCKVQLPPSSVLWWLTQIADVNSETCTVDEQMDRPLARDHTKRDLTEGLQPPAQSGVVGNGHLHLKRLCQRSQEPFGLPERKVKDHADRQSRLNRENRVETLAARSATGWCPPGLDGVVRKPDGQVTPFA